MSFSYKTIEAVIIAAGNGSRIIGDVEVSHKCLIPILHQKLIGYIIYNLISSGIERINIVTGYNGEKLQNIIRRMAFPVEINLVQNDEWNKGNGTSVFSSCIGVRSKEFVLTMADHWFTPDISAAVNDGNSTHPNLLAVDSLVGDINDLEDATKVKTGNDDRIIEIDKKLEIYNAIDCGIFRFIAVDIFSSLEKSFHNQEYSLSGGVRELIKSGRMFSTDITGKLWQDVDTVSDLQATIRKIKKYREHKVK